MFQSKKLDTGVGFWELRFMRDNFVVHTYGGMCCLFVAHVFFLLLMSFFVVDVFAGCFLIVLESGRYCYLVLVVRCCLCWRLDSPRTFGGQCWQDILEGF
jgi:hypothetical protein